MTCQPLLSQEYIFTAGTFVCFLFWFYK